MGIILAVGIVMVAFSLLPPMLAAAVMCAIVVAVAYFDPSMRKFAAIIVAFALIAYGQWIGAAAVAALAGTHACSHGETDPVARVLQCADRRPDGLPHRGDLITGGVVGRPYVHHQFHDPGLGPLPLHVEHALRLAHDEGGNVHDLSADIPGHPGEFIHPGGAGRV